MEIHWMCNSNKLKPIKKCQQQQPKTIAKNIIFKPKQSILKSVWHTNFVFWKKRKKFFFFFLRIEEDVFHICMLHGSENLLVATNPGNSHFWQKFNIYLASDWLPGNLEMYCPPSDTMFHLEAGPRGSVKKTLSSSFPDDGGRVGTMRRNRRPQGTCASS